MASVQFPPGFLWGAATASYQIEGGYAEDGKGESIWDRFCRTPGKVHNADRGDVACDHYHRYREDIELMAGLGLNAYRFSLAWTRIFPQGGGALNRPGMDFYDRLVDGLLDAGIQPFVTLYHWDLPQALQDRGGWANRDTVYYFRDYAAAVFERFGDRVHHWITHNEPWVVAFLGHETGIHAPGIRDLRTAVQASHHLLLSHGEAVRILREIGDEEARAGITLNLSPVHPATDAQDDHDAAQRFDGYLNRWFLGSLYRSAYPEDMLAEYGPLAPDVEEGDMEIIAEPTDFLGVNYYSRSVIRYDPAAGFLRAQGIRPAGSEYTEMNWEIYPEGLYELLKHLHDEYSPPVLYITENGAAFADEIGSDGKVHDPRRIHYFREHFLQAHRAIDEGIPLKGYFIWTLMDNFEWSFGYSRRFGLTYTDYPTQTRIVKSSGDWYREVIQNNGVEE